eukprot:g7222.t1
MDCALVLTALALACTTDEDCSLNGMCNASLQRCACDGGWKGEACEQLDLVPVDERVGVAPAYPPPGLMASMTSWGGSVVRADAGDGDDEYPYHMFVAEMLNGCGMATWSTNSVIRHAVAATPLGPFEQREVVMPAFAHNPTAVRAPDGTYLVYHIGCGTPNQGRAPCANCSGGYSGASCSGPGEQVACSANTTNILYSRSPAGPWRQLNAPFVKSATMGTPYQIDNPSVTFFPNGSLLMLGRGGDPAREAQSDGVITAPSWRGPYTMHGAVGTPASPDVEDPFVWLDFRGHYHALFHKFTDEHPGSGGHAFSRDGFDWRLTDAAAYETTVRSSDGAGHAFNRRERPHLLLEWDHAVGGPVPAVLYTTLTNWSSSGANLGHDKAFTFAQRIRQPELKS